MSMYVLVELRQLVVNHPRHQVYESARAFMLQALQVLGIVSRHKDFLDDSLVYRLIRRRYFVHLLYDMRTRTLVGCCIGRWSTIAYCSRVAPLCEIVLPDAPGEFGQEIRRRQQLRQGVFFDVWLKRPASRSFVWCDATQSTHTLYLLADI